jgi:hypothetical protein
VIEFVRGSLAAVGRTVMRRPDHDLRITLYPVIHVGPAAFCDALSEDLRRFRIVLLEGVRWKGFRGPLYDLAARNVGLVTQSARREDAHTHAAAVAVLKRARWRPVGAIDITSVVLSLSGGR